MSVLLLVPTFADAADGWRGLTQIPPPAFPTLHLHRDARHKANESTSTSRTCGFERHRPVDLPSGALTFCSKHAFIVSRIRGTPALATSSSGVAL